MFIKRFVPQSLFGRFLLIIVIPAVLFPLVATYVFYERHWKSVSGHMHTALAGEVAHLLYSVQEKPLEYQHYVINHMQRFLAFNIAFEEGALHAEQHKPVQTELLELEAQMAHYIDIPFTVSYASNQQKDIRIMLQYLPKQLLRVEVSRKRIENPSTNIFMLTVIITAFILLILAILFSKNQIRAITQLADVADKFGRGEEVTHYKPSGAKEVKKAAEAFIRMQKRLKKQVSQRLEMLAGISHDLRTPLTRMKLQISLMKESKETEHLTADIEEMEHMLNEYLDFVRGEGKESLSEVALREYFKTILAGYKLHHKPIIFTMEKDITIQLRPQAFKRTITNIVDNAFNYGDKVHITIGLNEEEDAVLMAIEDDGPGIIESEREVVFKPFYRSDNSRNSETGGVGLGLSIARDIINGHGGEIYLQDSMLGGLKVVISLPI